MKAAKFQKQGSDAKAVILKCYANSLSEIDRDEQD
jgi:hypothetical protein